MQVDWLEGELPPNLDAGTRALLQEAKRFLGDPYQWGGGHGPLSQTLAGGTRGPQGIAFDCSGFTRYLYAKTFGIDVGTYTGTQRYAGRHVKSEAGEALAPGDLVFFGGDYHHMGLYIGNGQFIHAPSTGDVIKISRMSSRSDFVEARRIVEK